MVYWDQSVSFQTKSAVNTRTLVSLTVQNKRKIFISQHNFGNFLLCFSSDRTASGRLQQHGCEYRAAAKALQSTIQILLHEWKVQQSQGN